MVSQLLMLLGAGVLLAAIYYATTKVPFLQGWPSDVAGILCGAVFLVLVIQFLALFIS